MDRRTLLKTAVATPVAAALLAAEPASALGRGRAVATGLDIPWGLDFLPDHSALVTERDSTRLLRIGRHGGVRVLGTVPGVAPAGEGGLLGLAVSPRFRKDRRIYLYFSTAGDNRVAWAQLRHGALGPLTPIVTGIPRGQIHNGGSLLFTRAGKLLIGCGETGNSALSQNVGSLGGKVLRVNRNGGAVRSNPFVGRDGDDRIFTYGHRNPQGLSQRKKNGALWSAELGQNTFDELNQLRAGSNYGWPVAEGSDGPGGYADPIAQWATADCSPSGVAIVGDRAWVGALRGESLWSVKLTGPNKGRKVRHLQGVYGRIRNVKHAPDGSLWFTTSNGGGRDQVVRVRI